MENYYNKAKQIMPGGVSSPVRALKAVGGNPLFIRQAKGAKLIDVNDKAYIDLCMSFGPLILGHAPDEVIESLLKTAANGTSFGTSSPLEVDLAEKIVKHHSATDWIRYVNSGTEAVMSAIRLARGVTERDLIVKFSGCYHGHADSMLVKAGSGLTTFGISSSKGVPNDVSKNTIVLDLGDLESVKEVFNKHGDNIAALIIEGIPANNGFLIQTQQYMKALQDITHEHGALFILDEVITGFRLGLGGATAHYGLNPDIITFGKVIGGGLPVGAYGGRKELMEYVSPLGPVYQAGTLSGNPLAMAAGNTTLSILENKNIYTQLDELGRYYENVVTSVFEDNQVPISLRRVGSINWLIFQDNVAPVNPDEITSEAVDLYGKFHQIARKEGIYFPPSAFEVSFLSTAHTKEVIDELGSIIQTVVKKL